MSDGGNNHETVRVELGARGYDILIGEGVIAAAGAEIAARLPGARAAIVTDENVAARHAAALAASLEAAGVAATTITVAPSAPTMVIDARQQTSGA